jgi:hypothetical protein
MVTGILVALVVPVADRADPATAQGMQKIVLNESITAAPKLTPDQRRAIALCFLLRYTRWTGPSLDAFYEQFIKKDVMPLVAGASRHHHSYQHVEYVGAGSSGIGAVSLGRAVASKAPGWFTTGFTRQEVGELIGELLDDPEVVTTCRRDPERLQLTVMHEDDLDQWFDDRGISERRDELHYLFRLGTLSEEAIRHELCDRCQRLWIWSRSGVTRC